MTNEYTPEMVHDAVARGADWLYEHCPNWVNEIDLDELDLQAPQACVLGQTAQCLVPDAGPRSGYFTVLYHHQLDSNSWPSAHGFDVIAPHGSSVDDIDGCADSAACGREMDARYEMLTLAWREYIREQLAVRA